MSQEDALLRAHREFTLNWSHRVGDKLSRMVYALLAQANAELEIDIRQGKLASLCAISVRQVQRNLLELEREWQLIQKVRSQAGNSYSFTPSLTEMSCPKRHADVVSDTPKTGVNVASETTFHLTHKEEPARVAAAAFKKHSYKKKLAAASPSVAPVVAALKPYVTGAQKIAVRIFENARALVPDITAEELAQLLEPEAVATFKRFQEGKVHSMAAVLTAWSRDLLGPEDVEELRDRRRKKQAQQNREEQQRLQQEQELAEQQRLWQEVQEGWQSLPEEHRSRLRKEYRAELLAKYPKANLWTRDALERHIELQARNKWAERVDDS